MKFKLVPQPSRVKRCASQLFRGVRYVQAKAAKVPVALVRTREEIAAAWRESSPNA